MNQSFNFTKIPTNDYVSKVLEIDHS